VFLQCLFGGDVLPKLEVAGSSPVTRVWSKLDNDLRRKSDLFA
jgi:hypothetical protein